MRPSLAALRLTTVLAVTSALTAAGVARADFVVQTCNGHPPAPFTSAQLAYAFPMTADGCTGASGAYTLGVPSAQIPAGTLYGVRVLAPAGEAISHVGMAFHSTPESSGPGAELQVGYGGSALLSAAMGDATAGTALNVGLPDAGELHLTVYCGGSSGNCSFPSPNLLSLGELDLTMHDTGAPDPPQATGGSLAAPRGAVGGTQTLLYHATAGGSGVDHVTVALGSTVAGIEASTCQQFALSPCPASTSGQVDVDTRRVPDGTYPVILTAYDASGDATPTQVSHVTVRNHSGTQTLLAPAPGRVRAQLLLGWRWSATRTTLTRLTVRRLPSDARLTVSCRGRGCPFTVRSTDARHLSGLRRALVGRAFRPRDRLTVTVTAPHRLRELARLVIRPNALPAAHSG